MSELEAAWRAFLLVEQGELIPADEDRWLRLEEAEELLAVAYQAAPIPSRERALVAAGMAAACCCCGGVSQAQVYCRTVFLPNPNRIVWNENQKKEGE